jgi:tetratricopeptide (TPR) repeat protein
MFVNTVHSGRLLVCRTITKPIYSTTMRVLVEDLTGQVELVSIHSGFTFNFAIEPDLLLPLHSVLLIKEPFVELHGSVSEIKVDSPSDLCVLTDLDKSHEAYIYLDSCPKEWALQTRLGPDELNKLGNVSFMDRNYLQAVRFYTRALNCACVSEEGAKRALSNRAAALLHLEKYYQAYEDGARAAQLESASLNEKVCFRMGEALYAMRQYERAEEAFRKCLALNEENKEAAFFVQETRKRMSEAVTGEYDMDALIDQARVKFQPRLNVANFVSAKIQVVPLKSNYLGKFCVNFKTF